VFNRTRAFEEEVRSGAMLWRALRLNRLKVAAGGCGGRGRAGFYGISIMLKARSVRRASCYDGKEQQDCASQNA
jgi:hypothetical protein